MAPYRGDGLQNSWLIKARYQASEDEDLLLLEVAELSRAKIQEHVEERLHLWGNAAVQEYSDLDDVPLSIRLCAASGGGSHGRGGAGSSWGPQLSQRRRFAFRRFHDNVAPYASAHVGISSMRFAPDLTSSTAAARLTSRPNPAGRVEM